MHRLVVLALAAALTGPAAADAHDSDGTLVTGITQAAELQMSRQGTYAGGDLAGVPCSWEWEIGSGAAYANTQAPSAFGLIGAHRATRNPAYLAAARCTADQAIVRYDAAPSTRPYSDDVVLLAWMSGETRSPLYLMKAASYHRRTRAAFPTGTALADYYIDRRLSLAGWDLESQIFAALSVGQIRYANAIAARLVERRADWENQPYFDGYDYTTISQGSLIAALALSRDPAVTAYRKEITGLTLARQDPATGAWNDDYQATAYILVSLASLPATHAVRVAANAALGYLLDSETPAGGWSYPPEYAEVNGEALLALTLFVDRDRGPMGHR